MLSFYVYASDDELPNKVRIGVFDQFCLVKFVSNYLDKVECSQQRKYVGKVGNPNDGLYRHTHQVKVRCPQKWND